MVLFPSSLDQAKLELGRAVPADKAIAVHGRGKSVQCCVDGPAQHFEFDAAQEVNGQSTRFCDCDRLSSRDRWGGEGAAICKTDERGMETQSPLFLGYPPADHCRHVASHPISTMQGRECIEVKAMQLPQRTDGGCLIQEHVFFLPA